jgi:FMN phosphatase YigB (HAD superfamily)
MAQSATGGVTLMTTIHDLVFLFDVDNTLLDNDRVQADMAAYLTEAFGDDACKLYWTIFEQLRGEFGYADYLGALERFRLEKMHDPRVLRMSSWLVDYPFADRLYDGAFQAIRHVQQWGLPVILSDGDAVFQPRKIERSGLWTAFEDRVLIYVHKERELAEVERLYPAKRYVMIDDKLHILDAVKKIWGEHVTTVFPRQGHYAQDQHILASCQPADIQLDRIFDLTNYGLPAFAQPSGRQNHDHNRSRV